MTKTLALIALLTTSALSQQFDFVRGEDRNSQYDVGPTIRFFFEDMGSYAHVSIFNDGVATIGSIYFDDQSVFDSIGIYEMGGVSFANGASPENPPGGIPNFATSFAFQATNPQPKNGINDGDYIKFMLTYAPDKSYKDVEMKAAVHVINLPDGASDGYVATIGNINPSVNIPEPTSLGLSLMGALIFIRRKR